MIANCVSFVLLAVLLIENPRTIVPHTHGRKFTKPPPTEIVTFFRSLTNQESFILGYALLGLRSDEIAGKLGITKLTVHTHRRNTMTKWHIVHLTERTGKRAAHEMLATIRPYAADCLPRIQ